MKNFNRRGRCKYCGKVNYRKLYQNGLENIKENNFCAKTIQVFFFLYAITRPTYKTPRYPKQLIKNSKETVLSLNVASHFSCNLFTFTEHPSTPRYKYGVYCSMFIFLCSVLYIIVER